MLILSYTKYAYSYNKYELNIPNNQLDYYYLYYIYNSSNTT